MYGSSCYSASLRDRLNSALRDIAQAQTLCNAPSISVGVLHNGEVILRESMGLRDVERGVKAYPDTAYRLASCSKILTSATLGVLVNEGTISLGDLIKKHLPEFNPSEDPRIGAEGKILGVCRHSIGLGNPNMAVNGPHGTIVSSGKDYVHLVNACPTSNEHGQRFRSWWFYSNIAYGLMANLAKAATGSSFVEILKTKVLEPLGLRQTLIS